MNSKVAALIIFSSLASISFASGQQGPTNLSNKMTAVLSPTHAVRDARFDKTIATAVRTRDKRFTFANEQEGRYTVLRCKPMELEIHFENYRKAVGVYAYTTNLSINDVKRKLGDYGAKFGRDDYAYISGGDEGSTCYLIQLKKLGPEVTRVTYSYECD